MTTYYEVREQITSPDPRVRGAIISLHETFAEAVAKAAELTAAGRNVAVCRSEWL